LPGAFTLRGKDVQADVTGKLHISINGPVLQITGVLEANGGWVDVAGNRFSIEHARFSFAGRTSADPSLDIRLMRRFRDVTVYIDVGGNAAKPEIALAADPPRYSQSEIIGLVLSGDPGN